jgi:hypothetical protein
MGSFQPDGHPPQATGRAGAVALTDLDPAGSAQREISLTAPRWLWAHPALLVRWLELANRWHRTSARDVWAVVLTPVVLIALVPASLAMLLSHAHSLNAIRILHAYRNLIAILPAAYVAAAAARQKARHAAEPSRSWLVGVSTGGALENSFRVLEMIAMPVLAVAGLCMAVMLFTGLVGAGSEEGVSVAPSLLGGAVLGGVIGVLISRPRTSRRAFSRHQPALEPTDALTPRLRGLSLWPIEQTRRWGRLGTAAWAALPVFLGLPMGTPALTGSAVVALWLVAFYSIVLISALARDARLAAQWLRPTAIARTRLTWHVTFPAVVLLIAGAALITPLLIQLGASSSVAILIALCWGCLCASGAVVACARSTR